MAMSACAAIFPGASLAWTIKQTGNNMLDTQKMIIYFSIREKIYEWVEQIALGASKITKLLGEDESCSRHVWRWKAVFSRSRDNIWQHDVNKFFDGTRKIISKRICALWDSWRSGSWSDRHLVNYSTLSWASRDDILWNNNSAFIYF